jgi:peptidoglycan-associated lipoprotein
MQKLRFWMLIIAVLAVVGCSSKGGEKQPPTTSNKTTTISPPLLQGGSNSLNGEESGGAGGLNSDSPNAGRNVDASGAPSERLIYFDFDKSDVRTEARRILEQHASFLTANPNVHIRLEGHADERGSREYNMALGDRRALSAKGAFNVLGIDDQRMNTLSYGEERPIDPGHNEHAWQLNRRVEIVY